MPTTAPWRSSWVKLPDPMARLPSAVLITAALASATSAPADVRSDYLLHCGGCHLPDARGAPPKVPDMRNELSWLLSSQKGRDYLVQAPGASQAPVTDERLAEIVNWLLTEYNADTLPPDFKPLTTEEVSAARKHVLTNPIKARQQLWQEYR